MERLRDELRVEIGKAPRYEYINRSISGFTGQANSDNLMVLFLMLRKR